MYQLVYVSAPLTNGTGNSAAGLLRAKVITNYDQKVSGCITFYENGFLHLLEGEKSAVLRTFSRISTEEGSHHVVIIYSCESECCVFDRTYILSTLPGEEQRFRENLEDIMPIEKFLQLCNPKRGEALAAKLFSALVKEKPAMAVSGQTKTEKNPVG